jgi:hypothetical protein
LTNPPFPSLVAGDRDSLRVVSGRGPYIVDGSDGSGQRLTDCSTARGSRVPKSISVARAGSPAMRARCWYRAQLGLERRDPRVAAILLDAASYSGGTPSTTSTQAVPRSRSTCERLRGADHWSRSHGSHAGSARRLDNVRIDANLDFAHGSASTTECMLGIERLISFIQPAYTAHQERRGSSTRS